MANRVGRLPTLFDGLDSTNHTIESNIPELPSIEDANGLWPGDMTPAWTGVALSRSDNDFTIHANVYSDIEPDDAMGMADDDYLVLGAWLEVPNDIDDAMLGDQSLVGILATGSDPFNGSAFAGLTGSATYEGPAIGIYEERPESSSDVRIGSFVATATLNADFSSGAVTADILNFTEHGESLGDWAVRPFPSGPIFSGNVNIHGNLQVSRDGGMSYEYAIGDWTASFYGNGGTSAHPTSVAGVFWTSVGSRNLLSSADAGFLGLTGALGAHITESNP